MILNVQHLNILKNKDYQNGLKKKMIQLCHLEEIYFKYDVTGRLEIKLWKKTYHGNTNQNKAEVATLISNKVNLKAKEVTKHKSGHYMMIKGAIHQEDIIILNAYAPYNRISKCMKQKFTELEGEIDISPIIVGDFTILISVIYLSSSQKSTRI